MIPLLHEKSNNGLQSHPDYSSPKNELIQFWINHSMPCLSWKTWRGNSIHFISKQIIKMMSNYALQIKMTNNNGMYWLIYWSSILALHRLSNRWTWSLICFQNFTLINSWLLILTFWYIFTLIDLIMIDSPWLKNQRIVPHGN